MIKTYDEFVESNEIFESNVNRIEKSLLKYDICILTSFRDVITDESGQENQDVKDFKEQWYKIHDKKELPKPNLKVKREWNRKLINTFLTKGYHVTKAIGTFKESSMLLPKIEDSIIVVNSDNDESFFDICVELGKGFNQDSILFKYKDDKNAFLYGTNMCTNNNPDNEKYNPKFDEKMDVGYFQKYISNFVKTQLRGHSFAFSNELLPNETPEEIESTSWKNRKNKRAKKYFDIIRKNKGISESMNIDDDILILIECLGFDGLRDIHLVNRTDAIRQIDYWNNVITLSCDNKEMK